MPTPLSRRPAAATARLATTALVAAAGFAGLVACGVGDGLVLDDIPATPPSVQLADAAPRPGAPVDREARTKSAGYIGLGLRQTRRVTP